MARDFEERERASAERDRRIRDTLLEHGHQPFGDKLINPKRKQTAYDYYRWMSRASSLSVNAGAYLGNLEREEHILGTNSYPADHPRHAHVEAGRYYPGGVEISGSRGGPRHQPSGESFELRDAATRAMAENPRVNQTEGTCVNCGRPVAPGEGHIIRRPSGYVTIHQNEQ